MHWTDDRQTLELVLNSHRRFPQFSEMFSPLLTFLLLASTIVAASPTYSTTHSRTNQIYLKAQPEKCLGFVHLAINDLGLAM
jgi:hypothetical protein